MGALILGTVTIDPSRGCVLLDREGGPFQIVWPSGAMWSADRTRVAVDGTQISNGAHVRGGGGFLDRTNAERLVGDIDDPASCGATDQVAVFNPGASIELVAGS